MRVTVNVAGDGKVFDGTSFVDSTPAFADVAASQTDHELVPAVAGKKIRVFQALMICGDTATNFAFNSKAAGNDGAPISPMFPNGANGGECIPFSPLGWIETNAGEALTVTTGAGSTTGVLIRYAYV